ncbi:MAG TPA: CAP domain-containing protein [Polyangiaceae bacterium]
MRWILPACLLFVTGCSTDDEPAGFDPDYCPKVADWDPAWAAFEDEVATLVNERRAEGGVCGSESFGPSAPLAMQAELRCAARNHSLDMATRGFFDHENPDGDGPAERISRAGFEWTAIGENIAQGQETPDAVMTSFMESPGHCANILEPRFEFIGVGYVGGRDPIWTQTFGAE